MAKKTWVWKTDLNPLLGKQVKIETRDGVYLTGLLTGLEYYRFEMDRRTVRVPTQLQLDKDPEKSVDVARIVRVDIVREAAGRAGQERDQ
jgi:small nuclear ribonucleoprotein (snRNP)-like protein